LAIASQALTAPGVWDSLQTRLVHGQGLAQTLAMAAARNAGLARVALSQAKSYQAVATCHEIYGTTRAASAERRAAHARATT
jgi:hypothetical protein